MLKIKANKYFVVVILLFLLSSIYFSWFAVLKHRALYTSYFDLGIMDQTVYNSSKGRILELSDPHGTDQVYRMSIHNDIFLALISPLYWIWQSPEVLLILQSVVVCSGALATYLIGKELVKDKRFSILLSISYLLYPALHGAILFDFHSVTLATSFILWFYYFLITKKNKRMLLFLILTLTTKENAGITAGLLILVHIAISNFKILKIRQRVLKIVNENKYLILISLLSIFYSIISFLVIIPYFRQGQHVVINRYQEFGENEGKIIAKIIKDPNLLFNMFTKESSIKYYAKLLSPFGFIPLLSPLWLVTLFPELLINVLSNEWPTTDIYHHYTALITPVIIISLIYGVKSLIEYKVPKRIIFIFLVSTVFYLWYKLGHVPLKVTIPQSPIEYTKIKELSNSLKDGSIIISGSNHTAPYFTERRYFNYFPDGYESSDYVILMTNDIYDDWKDKDLTMQGYEKLKSNKKFKLIERYGKLEVYKKIY